MDLPSVDSRKIICNLEPEIKDWEIVRLRRSNQKLTNSLIETGSIKMIYECIKGTILKFGFCILLLTPELAFSQSIVIDGDKYGKRISPALFGGGLIYSHEKDANWNKDTYDTLHRMRNSFMRYPGGEVASFYHWKKPTGFGWIDSWSPDFNGKYAPDSQFMSFDEYLRHTRKMKMFPVVGVNIESGHLYNRVDEGIQEAREFVSYAKSKADVEYWFIDNESYHHSSHARLTAGEYAGYINRYVPAMKEIDPGIKAVANWSANYWAGPIQKNVFRNDWVELLRKAGKNIDVIDVHAYWGWDVGSWKNYLKQSKVLFRGVPYDRFLVELRRMLDRAGHKDVELAVFEWGVSTSKNNKNLTGSQIAMISSDIFMEILDSQVVDLAAYWPIHWGANRKVDGHAFLNHKYEATSVQQMLSMFTPLKGGRYLTDVVSDTKSIKVIAGTNRKKSEMYIFVLNLNPSNTEISLNVRNIGSYSVKKITTQKAAGGKLNNGQLNWDSLNFDTVGGSLNTELPAWSLNRITIEM